MQQDSLVAVSPITLFYSYVDEDKIYQQELEKRLIVLRRQGLITDWHARRIDVGMIKQQEIDIHIQSANIILLLISPDYLASDYYFGYEMQLALIRHANKEILIVPVILRPCEWDETPLVNFSVLPTDCKPISQWRDRDHAFLDVVRGIRKIIQPFQDKPLSGSLRLTYRERLSETLEYPSSLQSIARNFSAIDRPKSYIPLPRNPLFQPRPGEFEQLERVLLSKDDRQHSKLARVIGLIGPGGVGKTDLAVELTYRYQHYFPSGVFWISIANTSFFEWQQRFAMFAENSGYLPRDDNAFSLENETRRSYHFCRYLAQHTDALLILDQVDDPSKIVSTLSLMAGEEIKCTILYTSQKLLVSPGEHTHIIDPLTEANALELLLKAIRPEIYRRFLDNIQDKEVLAARAVCRNAEYLPLNLIHLRGLLANDQYLELTSLAEAVKGKTRQEQEPALFATLWLSWEKIEDDRAKNLFILASFFPETLAIPLWLLDLAVGLDTNEFLLGTSSQSLLQMESLGFFARVKGENIRLHPLAQAFGRYIASHNPERITFFRETSERLRREFEDLHKLTLRVQNEGYWECMGQIQMVREYIEILTNNRCESLRKIEQWFARESYLLGDRKSWLETVPGLFYQQFFNRSVEEGYLLPFEEPPVRWLKQVDQVGADDPSLLTIFDCHSGEVRSAAFLEEAGNIKILTGSTDGTIRLWEMTSGKMLMTLKHHIDRVTCTACFAQGKMFITGSYDKTIQICSLPDGQSFKVLEWTDKVMSVAISPDETLLLAGYDDGTAGVWDIKGTNLPTLFTEHKGGVLCVAFSADGTKMLTGSEDRTIRLWSTKSKQLLNLLDGHDGSVRSAIFSVDGEMVLTGSNDRTARLWDARSGKVLAVLIGHKDAVTSVAFSPNSKTIATGSLDGTIRLWDVASKNVITVLTGHTGGVTCVAFSIDGSMLLSSAADGTTRLWKVVPEWRLFSLTNEEELHTGIIRCVQFSSNGTQVLTGSDDGTVRLWNIKRKHLQKIVDQKPRSILSMTLSPNDTELLLGSDDGTIRLWNIVEELPLIEFPGHTSYIRCMVFSHDGTQVFVGTSDRVAQLWKRKDGWSSKALMGDTGSIRSAVFSPDGLQLLTGSEDGVVRLWGTENGNLLHMFNDHTVTVGCIAFSPDGMFILSGSEDGTVRLWEKNGKNPLAALKGHRGRITKVAFSPDCRFAITCDEHGWVFLRWVKGVKQGKFLGMYKATYKIADIYWQDTANITLVDYGGPMFRPHFYRLHIEGAEE